MPLFPDNSSIRCLLLDIEGTTSSIDFVYKTLFPYASAHAEGYLREHFAEKEVTKLIESLRTEQAREAMNGAGIAEWRGDSAEEMIKAAASYVQHLIALDRKVTPLKTLQGMIWEDGFREGELKGHVYEDVPRAFAKWKSEGKRIAIFSSGSVQAQKLLFGYSIAGDLTKYIDAYFDTTTGAKREAASYEAIAKTLGLSAENVLFISDIAAELDAAREAGIQTALMLRMGNSPPNLEAHPCIQNFDGL
ncbi:MAG TPA: acireductone synthase [Candidatus Eremiobacteraceae bacterium]|nr:acireductone synthase [Candidatus Eremiobacteraceae bacterium]